MLGKVEAIEKFIFKIMTYKDKILTPPVSQEEEEKEEEEKKEEEKESEEKESEGETIE